MIEDELYMTLVFDFYPGGELYNHLSNGHSLDEEEV